MKTRVYILTAAMGALAMLGSCNSDPDYYRLPDQPDNLHITSSAETLMLEKSREAEKAITFSWDAVTSPGNASDSVTYALRLYATENKTNDRTDLIELEDAREISFTHDELNSIIGKWVLPGDHIDVTAQVLATFHNENHYIKPMSSTVSFRVTGYEKYPQYIYIHLSGDNGEEKTASLSQRTMGTGIYEGTLEMTPGTYSFSTRHDSAYPAYGNAGDGEHMTYVNEGEIPAFRCEAEGMRTIVVDTNGDFNDVRLFEIIELPGIPHMVGDGCPVGWDPSNMSGSFVPEDPRNPQLYSWTGQFNAGGEIKIALGLSWGDQFFFASEEAADPLVNHELRMYRYEWEGGDVKWVPSVSGRYTFTLCLEAGNMYTTFIPAE